ncbi:MAG: ABC transporter permease [Pirellula sp.]|nr:ABC transporter permease [Pirellula sp.]
MSLLRIAIRNLWYRKFPTFLTMFSMSLGVALVVLVLTISGQIERTFEQTSNVGYNLIVGAKGSSVQLVFNTVLFLSEPVENVPYSYYMEYMPGDEARRKEYERIGGVLPEPERKGYYSSFTKGGFAIPVCMGDYVGPFRCIGTTPEYFNLLKHGEEGNLPYEFTEGRNFVDYSDENGFFEAVIGSQVASEMKLKLGDEIFASHGAEGGETHNDGFKIVGILKPTGTPNDRGAFVNIEGFYLLEGHVAPERDLISGIEKRGTAVAPEREGRLSKVRLPIDKREVTAILVRLGGPAGIGMQKQVNKSAFAIAVSPISVLNQLLEFFVKPVKFGLFILTSLVCIVSAIGILVSIYNSMSERKRDIAVMRALGASRDHVTAIILLESTMIAVIGGVAGWLIGHLAGPISNVWTKSTTGATIDIWSTVSSQELWLVPGMILIGILAGLIPAIAAYRTSVVESL